MNQGSETAINEEMRPEYDFSGGVRGKYYEAYHQSTNVVVLDPDVAEVFRDSAAVNEALDFFKNKKNSQEKLASALHD